MFLKNKQKTKTKNKKSETFEIKQNSSLLRSFEQVVANIESRREQLVDVRGQEEFEKVVDGVDEKNHISNSKNLPYNQFFDKQNECLKSPDELKQCNN